MKMPITKGVQESSMGTSQWVPPSKDVTIHLDEDTYKEAKKAFCERSPKAALTNADVFYEWVEEIAKCIELFQYCFHMPDTIVSVRFKELVYEGYKNKLVKSYLYSLKEKTRKQLLLTNGYNDTEVFDHMFHTMLYYKEHKDGKLKNHKKFPPDHKHAVESFYEIWMAEWRKEMDYVLEYL